MVIRFQWTETAWPWFANRVQDLLLSGGALDVCEVGAGANPILSGAVVARAGARYTLVDASEAELAKSPLQFDKVVADISDPGALGERQFDLVISRFLIEHMPNADVFHRAVYRALRPGGTAAHFFPTLYAPPFVMNRLMPERLSSAVLSLAQDGRGGDGHHGKFIARYHGCRGPTKRQVDWIRSFGYEIEAYVGCFGHRAYYLKVPFLLSLHDKLAKALVRHPIPQITSFACMVVRRPM